MNISKDYSFVNSKNIKRFQRNIEKVGISYNRLTLIDVVDLVNKNFIGKFQCECGTIFNTRLSPVVTGYIKSCGCIRKEKATMRVKHGMSGSDLYNRWLSMKTRCKDETDPVYGGKGITYDPRWESFEAFYEDMAEDFSSDLEIDRIDVTRGYYKENCRWITHSENNFNKNKQSNNKSGKTGVCFHEKSGKFRAYIVKDGKQISLGNHYNFTQAVNARIKAELDLYGYTRP